MEAIQVSEASMVSMFRRAADAIINESSLKDEVDQLRMTADIQGRNIERLGNDKTALNDYVAELQRQLSDANRHNAEQANKIGDLSLQLDKLKDDNATLETLLNETEQARDHHKTEAEFNFGMHETSERLYQEAKAKLDGIMKTLGAILPQGQSEAIPTASVPEPAGLAGITTASSTDATSPSAAPEVAAESTFPPMAQQSIESLAPQPWSGSDAPTHVEDYSKSPSLPVEPSNPPPSSLDESRPNKPSDWMNF